MKLWWCEKRGREGGREGGREREEGGRREREEEGGRDTNSQVTIASLLEGKHKTVRC